MKDDHFTIVSRATGEHQHVVVPAGSHPSNHGYSIETHLCVKLDRAPSAHDRFDGTSICVCADAEARANRVAELNRMDRLEFLEEIVRVVRRASE